MNHIAAQIEIIPNFKIVSEPVVSKIRSKKSDGSGVCCQFFKLDEKRGLKLYSYRTFYDDTIKAHKLYAEHFPAPKIYEENLIFVFNDRTYYGYIVEIAEVLREILGLDLDDCDPEEDESCCDYLEIRDYLKEQFEAKGFRYTDFHSGNIGKIDENWMLIDFDGFYYATEKLNELYPLTD